MNRRSGVTLVELLVAMVLAAIVATAVFGWMLHAAKVSNASQLRDDREQNLSSVRSELFHDGTRGTIVDLARGSLSICHRNGAGDLDTVVWTAADRKLMRSGEPRLPADTVDEAVFVPRISGQDPDADPWNELDRDSDGKVDPDRMDRIVGIDLVMVVHHRGFPAKDAVVQDSIRIAVPLHGPG